MAKNSNIEWTDHTFNPWHGCAKVSPGCKNCYAEALTKRFSKGVNYWGVQGERKFMSDKYWDSPLRWDRQAEKAGIRHKVFCGSMCDVLEDRPDLHVPRERLLQLIINTPYLDWLLLTKRPENAKVWFDVMPWYAPHNIWLGTSVENQEMAEERIPELLKIPAKVKFLSCEPLLEKIDIRTTLKSIRRVNKYPHLDRRVVRVDWVIVGGESGPNKRPINLDWARSIRDQCKEYGVPFFMKQVDKVKPIPDDLMIREFPKILTRNKKGEQPSLI